LAVLYHELLGQATLEELLEHAADAVVDLVPCTSLLIAEVDVDRQLIVPVVVRGGWAEETLRLRPRFGEGLIGWAVEHEQAVLSNQAHRDSRAGHIAGTPTGEPEALACLPLVARDQILGALSLYREGDGACFSDDEFELACWFADAVTLSLANAKTRAQLEELASSDDLTGCLNRRGLCRRFPQLAEAAAAAHKQLALLIVDLDHFKQINDRFGHATGDLVLQHLAHLLRACAPEEGCVARLGGDEFAILMPVGRHEVEVFAATTAAAIGDMSVLAGQGVVSITASVGPAVSAPATATLAGLLEGADAAMYRARAATAPSRAEASGDQRRHRQAG
jgi:diguanylate cyclase (GGDEF)-like protein